MIHQTRQFEHLLTTDASTQRMRSGSRRKMLLASLAAACTTTALGCNRKPKSSDEPAVRTDVPLRLLWTGSEEVAAIIKRKWEAVAPQPLTTTTLSINRDKPSGAIDELVRQSKTQDLIVYPLLSAADLAQASAVIPQSDELLGGSSSTVGRNDSDDQQRQLPRLYPALRNGAARFAGQTVGAPIGANLPAVLSSESIEKIDSWPEYDRWVEQELGGAAAEPTADGWAGQMFLWRAATGSPSPWLFGPDELEPLIDQAPYVAALDQMLSTFKKYKNGLQTPEAIWNGITNGTLRGGIGWQVPSENESAEIAVANLPANESADRVLLDPFSLVVSISSGCRQSAVANEFIRWISAGEGSESLSGQIPEATATRLPRYDETSSPQRSSQYESWLRKRLSKPLTFPTLQLLSSDKYYAALDEQITGCLKGIASPKESLANVAMAWKTFNDQLGIKKQERAWRRAQGSKA